MRLATPTSPGGISHAHQGKDEAGHAHQGKNEAGHAHQGKDESGHAHQGKDEAGHAHQPRPGGHSGIAVGLEADPSPWMTCQSVCPSSGAVSTLGTGPGAAQGGAACLSSRVSSGRCASWTRPPLPRRLRGALSLLQTPTCARGPGPVSPGSRPARRLWAAPVARGGAWGAGGPQPPSWATSGWPYSGASVFERGPLRRPFKL